MISGKFVQNTQTCEINWQRDE